MADICPCCHAERELLPRSGMCETCSRLHDRDRAEKCRQIAPCGEKTEVLTVGQCRQTTLF